VPIGHQQDRRSGRRHLHQPHRGRRRHHGGRRARGDSPAVEPISHAIGLGGDAERLTRQGGEGTIRGWPFRRSAHRPQSRDPVPRGSDRRVRQLAHRWIHRRGGVVKPVARVNRSARMPAEAATKVGRSATKHDRHVESSGHGHVRPSPRVAFTEMDRRPGGGLERARSPLIMIAHVAPVIAIRVPTSHSIDGPMTVTSRTAALSGFPRALLASRCDHESIGPATGTPADWWPQRPRSCTVVSSPARCTTRLIARRPRGAWPRTRARIPTGTGHAALARATQAVRCGNRTARAACGR
jgi:hypothetical protein